MLDEVFAQTITWFSSKKKPLIILSIAIAAIFVVLRLLTSFAILYTDIDINSGAKTIGVYTSSDKGTVKAGGGGLTIISRDTKSIIITGGETMKTQTKITIPWYGFTYKKVRVVSDKNADKIAYNSSIGAACATYSTTTDKLSYFQCRNSNILVQYEAPLNGLWKSKKVADMNYTSERASPFMGGVIGITYQEGTDLYFPGEIGVISDSGQVSYYHSPLEFDPAYLSQARIFTDTYRPENNRFVLVDNVTGTIYLATLNQTSHVIDYRRIPAPADYSSDYNQTLCAVNDDRVYCYRGLASIGDIDTSDNQKRGLKNDSIISLAFSNDTIESFPVSDSNVLDNFSVTYDGILFGKNYKRLLNFNKEGNNYTTEELAQNVDIAAAGKNLYFIQDNGIFEVNNQTKDAYQVFYSSHILPKNLYIAGDKVFIIGATKEESPNSSAPPTLYAYLLNSQDNVTPGKRLIDQLPVDLPDTTSVDLVGDTLNIILQTNRTVTNLEIENKKLGVFEALKSKDITIPEKNIRFGY